MTKFSLAFRLDPVIKEPHRALVILLQSPASSGVCLEPIAARWAMSVPTTAFIGLHCAEEVGFTPDASSIALDVDTQSALRDLATRTLTTVLDQKLQLLRLDASRVVLVGFGSAGARALHLVLHRGWTCAGVLAFGSKLAWPLPRAASNATKVRLIAFADDPGHVGLRDDVTLLTARGIDTRGVVLPGSGVSQEAIRHGGAYLVELVATAQGRYRHRRERTLPRVLRGYPS